MNDIPEWASPGKVRYSVLFGGVGFLTFWGGMNFAMRPPWRLADRAILMDLKSEHSVQKMTDAGFNLIWTDFSNGRGPTVEKPMREEAKNFIELCHKYGIRVLPYVQFANIWWQDFFMDFPQAIKWLARDHEGKPINYGQSYWFRYLMCINKPGWVNYVKRVIREALVDCKADGIQLDNVVFPPCYCENCNEKFREYLRSKFDEATLLRNFGVKNLEDLKPPANVYTDHKGLYTNLKDPLVREWTRFRWDSTARVLSGLKKQIRSLNPNAILTGNGPVNQPSLGKIFDMLFEERALYPRVDFVLGGQRMISAVPDYKWGLSVTDGKMMVIDHHCRRGETGAWSSPFEFIHLWSKGASPSEAKLVMAEGFANGAYGVSPLSHEGQILITKETSDTLEAIKTYNHFLIRNEEYFSNLISWANVAVSKSWATLTWDSSAYPHITGFEQTLIQAHIPYDVLVDTNLKDRLSHYDTVILPNISCISDDQVQVFKDYVKNGGALIATGKTSLYDEDFEQRSDYGLAEVFGIHYYENYENVDRIERQYFDGKVVFFPGQPDKDGTREFPSLPSGWKQLVDAVKRVTELPLSVNAPNTVYVNTHRQKNGRCLLVHFVNYEEKMAHDIEVEVKIPADYEVDQTLLLTPDRENETPLKWKSDKEKVFFKISDLEIYDLVVLKLKSRI